MDPKLTAFAEFCREPLAIDPAALRDLQMRGPRSPEEREHRAASFLSRVLAVEGFDAATRRADGVIMSGRTAIMPIFGAIEKRGNFGEVSAEAVSSVLASIAADRQIRNVVMVVDSPGGSVAGIFEVGEQIRSLRDSKNVVAIADPMAASAAFWWAAQASELVAAPGAQVGSVGVISMHVDMGEMLKQAGIGVTLITSSKFKGEGHPFGPLGEEATGERQGKVNYYHGQFVEALAKGRGTTEHRVEKNFGEGRMMTPEHAKERGMIDRVASLETTLARLGGGAAADVGRTAAVMRAQARARAVTVAIGGPLK